MTSTNQLVEMLKRKCPNGMVHLSNDQMDRLLVIPEQNVQCWLSALMYYFTTGDLIGAVAKAIECLMASGVSASDIFECILNFLSSIIEDGFTVDALIDLFKCVLGQPGGGDGSEIDPPQYRNVTRCGQ